MELNKDNVVSKNDNFVETEADGEVILMHLDDGSFFSLSTTGKRIWELLDGSQPIASICNQLCSEFNVPEDQCLSDTITLLNQLQERNLIDVKTTPTAS